MENGSSTLCMVYAGSRYDSPEFTSAHIRNSDPDWSLPNLYMLTAALNHERVDQVLDILSRSDTDLDTVRQGKGTGSGLPFLEELGYRDHSATFLDRILASDPVQAIIRLHNEDLISGHMPLTMACLDGHYLTVTSLLNNSVRSRGLSEDKILWFLCYRLGETDVSTNDFLALLTAAETALELGADPNVSGTLGTYPLEGLIQNPVAMHRPDSIRGDDLIRLLQFFQKLCSLTANINMTASFRKLVDQLETILTYKPDDVFIGHPRLESSFHLIPVMSWCHEIRICLDSGAYPDAITRDDGRNPFQVLVDCLDKAHRHVYDLYYQSTHLTHYSHCVALVHDVYARLAPNARVHTRYQPHPTDAIRPEVIGHTIMKLFDMVMDAPEMYVSYAQTILDHLSPSERLQRLQDFGQRIKALSFRVSRHAILFGDSGRDYTEISRLSEILKRLKSPCSLTYLARRCILELFRRSGCISETSRLERIQSLTLPLDLQRFVAGSFWNTTNCHDIRISLNK